MKRSIGLALLLVLVGVGIVSLLPRTPHTETDFLNAVRKVVHKGDVNRLRALGETPDTLHWHIWLHDKDSLPNWSVSLFPAPKGYAQPSEQWLIFHKFQLVQELCDRVHPVRKTANGYRLGAEVPESVPVPFEIAFHDLTVRFEPKARKALICDQITVKRTQPDDRALLMRLNAPYSVRSARYNGKAIPVMRFDDDPTPPLPQSGYWLGRAGGLVWLQGDKPLPDQFQLELEYDGVIEFLPDDRVNEQVAVLCSYWYPHIGRLPAKHRVTIHTPPDWLGFGQGNRVREVLKDGERITTWQNDLSVCFFSVVAGAFRETASARSQKSGIPIRVFQIDPDPARAQRVAQRTAQAMDFLEKRLSPYPYREYIVLEVPDFGDSGLEAYSFTFVDPTISEWAGSHELAHTWWGGIVPNTYIRSIWSESLTQYVDSVLFANNEDGTLQLGLATMTEETVPIGSAYVPLDPVMSMAGYMRGAYVMRMLENEIGLEAMVSAMRRFLQNRKGKASEWEHFQQAVNQTTGKDYRWFFKQWIERAEFPVLEIVSAKAEGNQVRLRLRQSGTSQPFRLRLPVRLISQRAEQEHEVPLVMTDWEQEFSIETPFTPRHLSLEPERGYSLVRKPSSERGNPFRRSL